MKIVITGSESFVGRELQLQCRVKSIDFVGIDNVSSREATHLIGDIRSKDIADLIPENVDALVHLAAISRDNDCRNNPYLSFDVNVLGALNLINAARFRNVQQFIFASSEWVYGECKDGVVKNEETPIDIMNISSPYALSKLVSEVNLRQEFQRGFCPVTILRFGIIYGSRERNWSAVESLFYSVAKDSEVNVGSLNTGRHFIHVTDIASAIIKSIGLKGFEILNIEGDTLIKLSNVIETSGKILEKTPKVIETDSAKANIRLVSNKKAKEILGWKPEVSLEKGLILLKDFLGIN